MSRDALVILIYLAPAIVIFTWYLRGRARHRLETTQALAAAQESGLTEPASLHPVVDPLKCVGCGACIAACPEAPAHRVLGLLEGKAHLVSPTDCIGHGACHAACPVDAITLVFGTARRGVDIPVISPAFETTVPGIFIAGELGGMGLIRNAIEQGRQAMQSVLALPGIGKGADLDVVIVGAGPAGLSASLAALSGKLRFVTLEQHALGGTVAHFPRGKLVMTRPAELPLVGKVKFTETTKEALLAFWRGIEQRTGLSINYGERLQDIACEDNPRRFTITTDRATYRARSVLLAMGRRGTPRMLGVPGEELPKVIYTLIDAGQYAGARVLVVGGGDSALEAAIALAETAGTQVTLSYRSGAFSRAKRKNRERLEALEDSGSIEVLFNSTVLEILPDSVQLVRDGVPLARPNDTVLVCAGGILPTPFLKNLGITVETRYGTA